MAINISVAGYGNLGKQLVGQIRSDNRFKLKYVFSRRNIDLPERRNFTQANELAEESDVLVLALGSYDDIEKNLQYFSRYDTVDCFDTHDKMEKYKQLLERIKPETFSLFAAGWDPGLLSLSRGLFNALGVSATLWGKGQSMGHGNAIRSVGGVLDAVQFTCPVAEAESLFANGETNTNKLIKRVCYVAAVEADKENIKRQILEMPCYFKDYQTEVNFVEKSDVARLRKDMSHRGKVLGRGNGWQGEASLVIRDNAAFTAKIMLCCASAAIKCKKDGYKGAFSLFDLTLRYFVDENCL